MEVIECWGIRTVTSPTAWGKQRLAASLFLVLGTDMFIVSPLLPQISRDYSVTAGEASVMGWSFSLVYAVLSPVFALLTNRFTRRAAMGVGGAIFSAGALATALLPSLSLVIVGRVLAGVGAAIMGPPVWSFATETAAPHEVGRAVAGVAGMFAAGQVVGVPLGSQIAALTSWRWAFFVTGVFGGLLALLIATRLGPEARTPDKSPLRQAARDSVGLWRNPFVARLVTANFFAQATRYATYTFAGALLFSRFGLETGQLGLVGAAVGLGSLVGSTLGGRLVDRAHARGGSQPLLNVLYAALMSLAVLVATTSPVLWIALVGWVLTFATGSAFVGNGQQMVSRETDTRRAYALAWNNTALYAGSALGTFLLGLVPLGTPYFAATATGFGVGAIVVSLMLWSHTTRRSPS